MSIVTYNDDAHIFVTSRPIAPLTSIYLPISEAVRIDAVRPWLWNVKYLAPNEAIATFGWVWFFEPRFPGEVMLGRGLAFLEKSSTSAANQYAVGEYLDKLFPFVICSGGAL